MSRVRPLRNETQIMTIFGEIESIVATLMAGEHGLHKIDPSEFPPTVDTSDDYGRSAKFAIVMPAEHLIEFHERVARLRARASHTTSNTRRPTIR